MDAERALLSCPGRVQDWLGTAADQIETLLQVPLPSLSCSDQAIGALRIKRERPSRMTGPYNLRSTNLVSGTFPTTYQDPLSASPSRPSHRGEKSPSRCENCVAEKGSRCSRDLPSCTRCRKNGTFCFYLESVPTGRRKPQGRRRGRSRTMEEPGPPMETFLVVPVSEHPTILEPDEVLAAQYCPPDMLHAVFEYAQSSAEECSTISPIGSPTYISSAGGLENHQYQTVATKRQITMLPATPTFGPLPPGTSKLETARETARAELHSKWPGAIANGWNPSSARGTALAAATKGLCQDPGSEGGRKTLEEVLRKCADKEIQQHADHLSALPLESQAPSHRQTSAASSLATTPFASTLASRSTSQSSGTDSLPITPATELPTLPDETNAQWAVGTSISASFVSHTASPAFSKPSATDDVEARLSHMEQLVDLYLLSRHLYQTTCDTVSSADPQDKSFSDRFVEELFEEGDAAKRLVDLQRRSPKKRKVSWRP